MKGLLAFEKETTAFCCGLVEIGEFNIGNDDWVDSYSVNEKTWDPDPDKYYIATTTRAQSGSAKRLKRLGFKKLGSWTRDSGVRLTLWGYRKRRSKK